MMLAQVVYSEPSAVASFPPDGCSDGAISLAPPLAPGMHPSSSVQVTIIVSADLDPDPPQQQLLIIVIGSDATSFYRLPLDCGDGDSTLIRYHPSLLSVAMHMRPYWTAHFERLHNVPAFGRPSTLPLFDRTNTNKDGRRP